MLFSIKELSFGSQSWELENKQSFPQANAIAFPGKPTETAADGGRIAGFKPLTDLGPPTSQLSLPSAASGCAASRKLAAWLRALTGQETRPHSEGFPVPSYLRGGPRLGAGLRVRGAVTRPSCPGLPARAFHRPQRASRTALKPGREEHALNFNEDLRQGSWLVPGACVTAGPELCSARSPGASPGPLAADRLRRQGGHLGRKSGPQCRIPRSTGSWRAEGGRLFWKQSFSLHPSRQPFSIPCGHTGNSPTSSHTCLCSAWPAWPSSCLGF